MCSTFYKGPASAEHIRSVRWRSPSTPATPARSAARSAQRYGLAQTGWILIVVVIMQDSVKRQAVGIWKCNSCKKVIAGGAWTVSTTAAATVRRCVLCRHALLKHRGSCLASAPFVGSGRSRRRNLVGSRFMLCFPLPPTHIYVPRYEHHQYSQPHAASVFYHDDDFDRRGPEL